MPKVELNLEDDELKELLLGGCKLIPETTFKRAY